MASRLELAPELAQRCRRALALRMIPETSRSGCGATRAEWGLGILTPLPPCLQPVRRQATSTRRLCEKRLLRSSGGTAQPPPPSALAPPLSAARGLRLRSCVAVLSHKLEGAQAAGAQEVQFREPHGKTALRLSHACFRTPRELLASASRRLPNSREARCCPWYPLWSRTRRHKLYLGRPGAPQGHAHAVPRQRSPSSYRCHANVSYPCRLAAAPTHNASHKALNDSRRIACL